MSVEEEEEEEDIPWYVPEPKAKPTHVIAHDAYFGLLLKFRSKRQTLLPMRWTDRDRMTKYACRNAAALLKKHRAKSLHAVRVRATTTAEEL